MPKGKEMINLKKHKFWKKLLLIFTIVLMLCSALPVQVLTQVSAESKNYEILVLFTPEGYGQKNDIQVSKNGKIKAGGTWRIITNNGDIAYCLEPGKSINTNNDYIAYYKDGTIALSENQKRLLGRIFLYGYAKKPSNLYDYAEYLPQYIATQLLTWEVIVGQRDANFNLISNSYTPVKNILSNFNNAEVGRKLKVFMKPMKKISRLMVKRFPLVTKTIL